MAGFMEWQQRLDGGHWLERGWLGDNAKVVVDHGAIDDRNKVSERPRRASPFSTVHEFFGLISSCRSPRLGGDH
jgi:hypothetical protein